MAELLGLLRFFSGAFQATRITDLSSPYAKACACLVAVMCCIETTLFFFLLHWFENHLN
jgi:hypothetical protein